MKKELTVNTFDLGLIMDLNPLVTPNNVLCNALNATLITMNGNENVLQNDMGNARVETAFLPEGYIPMGTAELGGIIYIVSYNPLTDKCQIGSFPSPERNITSSEIQSPLIKVSNSLFLDRDGKIINTILKVKLLSDPTSSSGLYKLNPGDKYTIYSTNNGISNNLLYISDVNNPNHTIDGIPRNVTIHVVSIGEDGKIVYLDNSLKWSDDSGTPPNYYIKECEEDDDIFTDIDKYRSLVSSAYNIFNSKVSGELALLFELKVIDSFSVTWDVEVNDINEELYDKSALVLFNINYTSSHSSINLHHIILSESEYQGSNFLCPVSKGYTCTIDNSSIENRVNDGSDLDIPIEVGSFKYLSNNNLLNYIWNYTLTPAMSFGYLEYLNVKGTINFSDIGSGKITMDEWRYFIQDNNFYLNWGLSAYPEKNKIIDNIILTFIPFDLINENSIILNGPSNTKYPQYIIENKSSYSGYFLELINFGTSSKIKNGLITKNNLYLVDICIKYGNTKNWEYRHIYKWLYTTKLWNDKFKENLISDFSSDSSMTLDNIIKIESKFDITDNIDLYSSNIYSTVNIPRSFNREDLPYITLGAQIKTVNFNTDFDTLNKTIEADILTLCTSYPELYTFTKKLLNYYKSLIIESYILTDESAPTSDKLSSLALYVYPVIKNSEPILTIDNDLSKTINSIQQSGINSNQLYNKALDLFEATLTLSNDSISLNIVGAIFSKINADLQEKLVTILLQIRPLLCYESDYSSLGLVSDLEFNNLYHEEHRNLGGGKPFAFRFTDRGWSKDFESGADDWDPLDGWREDYWWDGITPYTNYLNVWLHQESGSIQCMLYLGGTATHYNEEDILNLYGLLLKSSEGHYVPTNCFADSESKLSKLVALLYTSLYYVDTNPDTKLLAVVLNINYMTNYYLTWNIVLLSKLYILDIEDNIYLGSGNISLKDLKSVCERILGENINLYNISLTNREYISLPDTTISHTFFILNLDMYNTYETFKSTSIPSIAQLSTSDNWFECSPRVLGTIYVYNNVSNTFELIGESSVKYIYTNGTITVLPEDNNGRKRIIVSNQSTETGNNPVFGSITFNNNELKFTENKILLNKGTLAFQTDAKGKPWGLVFGNNADGLTKQYKKQ